jgi:DNA-3-methyladenine glycosylase II
MVNDGPAPRYMRPRLPGRVHAPTRNFGRSARQVTYLTPPTLSSLPRERDQLEYSSRSLVFPEDGDRLLRVWGAPEAPCVLAVEEAGARWKVTGWGIEGAAARTAVRALFSLDHPLEAFYQLARAERVLRTTPRRFRGLRLPRDANLYESLVHAILGQQLSVRAANTIKGRLIESANAFVDVEGTAVPRLPSPTEMDRLGPDGLRRIGASGAKARALLAIGKRWTEGALDDHRFTEGTSDEAIERLDAEPGVGRWTAENALLRGVGRTDLFVAGDLGLRVALDRFGVLPRTAPEADARAWAERWYPGWGSYATLYLWRRQVTEPEPD